MKAFLLFLAFAIAIPAVWRWSKAFKDHYRFEVRPFENYWENVNRIFGGEYSLTIHKKQTTFTARKDIYHLLSKHRYRKYLQNYS